MKTKIAALTFFLIFSGFLSTCEMINPPGPISGSLLSHSDCKYMKNADPILNYPDSLSCILYSYNVSEQVLSLEHINTAFNCCPGKLTCAFSLKGDTIIIEESEKEAGCDCNCLFDLAMEIQGVEARAYFIKMEEPYVLPDECIIFQIDFSDQTNGSFCLTRMQYPWGLESAMN